MVEVYKDNSKLKVNFYWNCYIYVVGFVVVTDDSRPISFEQIYLKFMTLIPVILSKVMAALKTPICKYWPNCYQKNEKHKKAFRHPEVEEKKVT